MMQKQIDHLLLSFCFYTRYPLPKAWMKRLSKDANLSQAATTFPIVGLLIAIVPAMFWVLNTQTFPYLIDATLTIALTMLITGALHEDGLADCCDGMGAYGREKTLAIMSDSQIGTYGTLALIFSVGLRIIALASVSPISGMCALFIAHSGSRAAIAIAMRYSTHAKDEGLGASVGKLPKGDLLITVVIAYLLAFLFGTFAGIIALTIALLFAWGFLKFMEKRIGGYTGDVLGGMQQVAEITIMVALAGMWS